VLNGESRHAPDSTLALSPGFVKGLAYRR
jgi:hypothetical protein